VEIAMQISSHTVQINWSVWDRNPTVSWTCDGILASVTMKLRPVAISHFQCHELIAIIGNFDEFGSANLLLYTYDGTLQHTITAPALGQNTQFGGASENNGELQATFGWFQIDAMWKEETGRLNLDDGTVTSLHRTY
jgi:hypothetical protein